ncbi:MAG TPA: methionine--tRNA ligase [Nanoarchaeota archaeon]|nr:methionine--tRNA ligase [Nanoarchaeota archaeon]
MVNFKGKFYITTAIDYVNAKPHIGHVFEKLIADCIARWKRILGYEVFFLTGTDEHGIKNQKAAEKLGLTPREFVDKMSKEFYKLKDLLNLSIDFFIRTSDEKIHYPVAQEIWEKLVASGDIYKKKYSGYYCSGCEAFVKKEDLVDGKCPNHGKEPELIEEENYFFKLSKYALKVAELIEKDEIKIVPETRKKEILSFIKQGVEDVSFSREKSRVYWGIPVPGDENQVIYVWCDALVNYLSGVGYVYDPEKFKKFWPADVHVIGKDILRFHALIWPAMLLSAGLALPKTILVHGMITSQGKKMSKTLGNVVDPFEYIEEFGYEALRYYLLREIPTLEDGDFTRENFIKRYNADLADNFGNLVRRAFLLAKKFFGYVPKGEQDKELWEKIEKHIENYKKEMENFRLNLACAELWKIFSLLNEYLNEKEPWKNENEREKVIRNILEALRVAAILLHPFLPESAEKILKALGLEKEHLKEENIKFGLLKENSRIEIPEIFFRKIEESKSNEPFSFLDLRVGEIENVEEIEGSDKLYKLLVNLGNEKRILVAGLKQYYSKEELKGKHVIVLCNIKPRKILGITSQGMVLAAIDKDNKPVLLTTEAQKGEVVYIEGIPRNPKPQINIEEFLNTKLEAKNGIVYYKDKILKAGEKPVATEKPISGKIR